MGRAGVFQTSGCGFEPRCPLKAVAIVLDFVWRGGRAVDCNGLENRRPRRGSEGSNPSPSAKFPEFGGNPL